MAPNLHFSSRQRGATLVELVMTIVIISVAIAGVVGAFSLIAGRSADPLNQTRAVALAQIYMDEILSRRFDEETPIGGTPEGEPRVTCLSIGTDTDEDSRAAYDDVDDYDNINDALPENADDDRLGADYDNFRVTVDVVCAGDDFNLADLDNGDAKRIDLTITDPSGNPYNFSVYKANF